MIRYSNSYIYYYIDKRNCISDKRVSYFKFNYLQPTTWCNFCNI